MRSYEIVEYRRAAPGDRSPDAGAARQRGAAAHARDRRLSQRPASLGRLSTTSAAASACRCATAASRRRSPLGHEIAGEVVAVRPRGRGASKPGDRRVDLSLDRLRHLRHLPARRRASLQPAAGARHPAARAASPITCWCRIRAISSPLGRAHAASRRRPMPAPASPPSPR